MEAPASYQKVLEEHAAGHPTSAEDQSHIFYGAAVESMKSGDCDKSVKLLNRACVLAGGILSTRGGEMRLWLALALDAAALSKRVGSDEEAQALRKQLMQGQHVASSESEALPHGRGDAVGAPQSGFVLFVADDRQRKGRRRLPVAVVGRLQEQGQGLRST